MLIQAVAAALALGAVMTLGDFLWAHFSIRHTVWAGVAHGAAMCLCLGAVVGARTGRLGAGLLAGPVIGVLAAAAFYAMAPAVGMGAMVPAWMLFWICFALLQHYFSPESLQRAMGRGVVAAVLSGLAFYAISGIWTRHSPGGPNYPQHFLYWSFAFLPGFLALFAGHSSQKRPG